EAFLALDQPLLATLEVGLELLDLGFEALGFGSQATDLGLGRLARVARGGAGVLLRLSPYLGGGDLGVMAYVGCGEFGLAPQFGEVGGLRRRDLPRVHQRAADLDARPARVQRLNS